MKHDMVLHTAPQYHRYHFNKIFNILKTCLSSNVHGLPFVGFWRKLVVLDGDFMLCCFIPGPVSCDETFTNLTGVIYSPNYPADYHNGASCHYSITVPEGFVSDFTKYNENRELQWCQLYLHWWHRKLAFMTTYRATIDEKAGVMTTLGSVVSIFSCHFRKVSQWEKMLHK